MSQQTLADALRKRGIVMSAETVSRLESGGRGILDYEVKALTEILEVDVAWLFGVRRDGNGLGR